MGKLCPLKYFHVPNNSRSTTQIKLAQCWKSSQKLCCMWTLWNYSNDPITATSGKVSITHPTYILLLSLSCCTSNLFICNNPSKVFAVQIKVSYGYEYLPSIRLQRLMNAVELCKLSKLLSTLMRFCKVWLK